MNTANRLVAVAIATLGAGAAAAEGTMYRCPGNEYNNTLGAREAAAKGCKTLEGTPITVIQSSRPRPVPSTSTATAGSGPRVDPGEQRARDTDARRILEAELKREEGRLAEMKTEFNNGQPERLGNEKNYQKYLDRVADMKAAIGRKESDVTALRRELAKQPL